MTRLPLTWVARWLDSRFRGMTTFVKVSKEKRAVARKVLSLSLASPVGTAHIRRRLSSLGRTGTARYTEGQSRFLARPGARARRRELGRETREEAVVKHYGRGD